MRASALDLVVFDWDGTLMDSVGSIVACTRAVIAELGLAEADERTIRGTVGLGLRETVERLVPACDDEQYGSILTCYRRHWVETFRHQQLLFPEVPAMLAELAGAGYLLAVATGNSRRGLDHAFEQTGLRGSFHATRTADEAISKPHPRMLFDIFDELGVHPSAALMVGDSVYDLRMAANAGADAVAILSGALGRAELETESPCAVLDRVTDLPAWLAREGRPAPTGRHPAPAAV